MNRHKVVNSLLTVALLAGIGVSQGTQKPVTKESLEKSTRTLAGKAFLNGYKDAADILLQAAIDIHNNDKKVVKKSSAVCHTDMECEEYARKNNLPLE